MKSRLGWQLMCAGLVLLAATGGWAEDGFDLIVRGGRIVDGTGNPWFVGDVAMRGDRIVAVARAVPAAAARD